jgi:hypothetical protein
VFENWGLRGIFGVRRDGVTGEWRKLHKEELNDQYCSTKYCAGDKMEKIEMDGECGTNVGEERRIQCFVW